MKSSTSGEVRVRVETLTDDRLPGPRVGPTGVVGALDETEEKVRGRFAENRFFRSIFLLDRDWMTRITMLMVLAGLVWAIAGSAD
ncbi:MAG: hypothetical protein ACRD6W_01880, partial [Nitrososphaerales archaeon]